MSNIKKDPTSLKVSRTSISTSKDNTATTNNGHTNGHLNGNGNGNGNGHAKKGTGPVLLREIITTAIQQKSQVNFFTTEFQYFSILILSS